MLLSYNLYSFIDYDTSSTHVLMRLPIFASLLLLPCKNDYLSKSIKKSMEHVESCACPGNHQQVNFPNFRCNRFSLLCISMVNGLSSLLSCWRWSFKAFLVKLIA